MLFLLAILAAPIVALMLLKLARTIQELRVRRAGLISFGGDDRYQARNVHLNVHDALMIARVKLSMSAEAFQALIDRVERNFTPWIEQLSASIEHKPEAFEAPLEILDETRAPRLTATPVLGKIVLCRNEQVVFMVGNHVYLGGYLLSQFVQIVFCRQISKDVFPRNRYLPVVSEVMMLALLAKLLVRPRREQPSALHAHGAETQRFYLKQELRPLKEKAASLGMHAIHLVIAQHVFTVMRRLKRDRLRVTLPVSFSDDHTFNTVGAAFLDVDREPDLDAMAKKIRRLVSRSPWQVSASNHIQRIFPTRKLSQGARNTVDLTLTVVPQKTLPGNLLTREMTDYEFTMDNIEYPVYAMAFIFEDRVHTSFMINTPDFDVDAFVAEDGAVRSDLTLARAVEKDA